MICQNNNTNVKYNYQMPDENTVKLWNPTCRPFFISRDEWSENYFVVDKWLKL